MDIYFKDLINNPPQAVRLGLGMNFGVSRRKINVFWQKYLRVETKTAIARLKRQEEKTDGFANFVEN